MKKLLMTAGVLVVSMFISCAIFVYDNDDDSENKQDNSSRDTITIIYSHPDGNPLSAR
jgi:protein involved in sex pheromone biosynthesis